MKIPNIDKENEFKSKKFDNLIKKIKNTDSLKNNNILKKNDIESLIFNKLKKKLIYKKIKKNLIEKKIYKKIKIISKKKLEIKIINYYKFPFNPYLENDNSKYFLLIQKEWFLALTNIYKLYRKNNQNFFIYFSNFFFIFEKEIFCSNNFKNILEKKKINFIENNENNFLKIINNHEILFDFILNVELNFNEKLPFILSKNKFYNSICYSTKIIEAKKVKFKNEIKFYYLIDGYLYGPDFEKYDEEEIIFENI